MSKFSGEFLRLCGRKSSGSFAARMPMALGLALAIALLAVATVIHATEPEDIQAELQAASALHRRADYAHSIPILKRIVQRSPRNYLANLLLGEDLLRSGSVREAMGPLQAASKARPDDGAAQAYLAEAATALGDFSSASEALESAVAGSGGAEQYLMAWANFCIDRFRFLGIATLTTKRGEGAELRIEAWSHPEGSESRATLLEQSVAADPEQRGIWGELGAAQLESQKRAQSVESLKEAEKRDPQDAETMRLEALLAASEQNWQAAGKRLSALGARSPAELGRVLGSWPPSLMPGPEVSGTVWGCLRNLAVSCPLVSAPAQGGEGLSAKELYAKGRWEQLKALAPIAATDSPESLWRGVALARTGDYAQAIPTLERGLKADERLAEFWLQVCYAKEEARTEERLSGAGNEAGLHELRGDVALRIRYDAAVAQKEYASALKARPNDPRLLARMAEACKVNGDTVHAREAALAALAVDPRQLSAMRTLAQLAINQRDYAEALIRLKQLAVMEPKDAWTQVELGVAYGKLGRPSEAAHCLGQELAAGYPDKEGALHAQLASALRKLGREDEARQAAAEASRLANSSLQSHPQGNADAPQ
jgi:tetratricopeptide (TPR) repeat protein